MDWVVAIVVAVAMRVVAYIITPKPKQPKAASSQDVEVPTAEAGIPICKIQGMITLKTVNTLGYWQKSKRDYQIKV